MRCVRDQFANFGIHVRRMHGIDSLRMDIPKLTLLPSSVKRFLASHPDQVCHVGCLYGHIRCMMGAAAGEDGAAAEVRSGSSGGGTASAQTHTTRGRCIDAHTAAAVVGLQQQCARLPQGGTRGVGATLRECCAKQSDVDGRHRCCLQPFA